MVTTRNNVSVTRRMTRVTLHGEGHACTHQQLNSTGRITMQHQLPARLKIKSFMSSSMGMSSFWASSCSSTVQRTLQQQLDAAYSSFGVAVSCCLHARCCSVPARVLLTLHARRSQRSAAAPLLVASCSSGGGASASKTGGACGCCTRGSLASCAVAAASVSCLPAAA